MVLVATRLERADRRRVDGHLAAAGSGEGVHVLTSLVRLASESEAQSSHRVDPRVVAYRRRCVSRRLHSCLGRLATREHRTVGPNAVGAGGPRTTCRCTDAVGRDHDQFDVGLRGQADMRGGQRTQTHTGKQNMEWAAPATNTHTNTTRQGSEGLQGAHMADKRATGETDG